MSGSLSSHNSASLSTQMPNVSVRPFVAHKDKKELEVATFGDRYTVDFGYLCKKMTDQLRENVTDPALCDWILPDFTTTTKNDGLVSAVVMMATLKKYFDYTLVAILCGIPRVTLEGDKADWEKLFMRIEKLKEYGNETTQWYHLLRPVLSRFIAAFDDPYGRKNLDFWRRVAHYRSEGCGQTFLSGWLTAFCVFDVDGKWLGNPVELRDKSVFSVPRFFDFGRAVDVKLDDNGVIFEATMVAGTVGFRVCKSHLVKPVPGWWIFTQRGPKLRGRGDEEKKQEMEAALARIRKTDFCNAETIKSLRLQFIASVVVFCVL
uniref:Uncharacterized protein n=1 Tax=Moniliophthora roreri TaxID=221103 RepID=A0A0W0FYN1_MONRR